MDTPSEECFDKIAKLSTQIFDVPISLLSLVDAERVFFKANVGMGKAKEANRGKSLCALAVLTPDVTVFEDALKEPCLIANPNVAGDFGLRFYAGAPLITNDGFLIGTLCIIDKKPRTFSDKERAILAGLADSAMDQIELRLAAQTEVHKQQEINEELTQQREEIHAMNEELTAANEELMASGEILQEVNDNLSASEERFRNLIRQSPIAIGTLKGRSLIIDCVNDLILKIWGKDDTVVGLPLHIALPELEGQPFLQILDDVFTSGRPYKGTEAKVTIEQDGTFKDMYLNFVYQPIHVAGKTKDIMVVANDVTEQVEARKTVDEAKERLEIALNAGALGSYDVDLDTGIMNCTEQCKLNFGLPKEATFNFPDLVEAILPEFREYVQEQVNRSLMTREIYEAEYQVKWPDGSIHWVSAHGKPGIDEQGNANRMVGVTVNITERKQFEQRKDDFLSIASHELKTPITSLKASLQLLDRIKEKPTSPMHIKLIEQSGRSMDKMSILVDELLNVNRMTEGQLKLDKSTFTIAEMLNLCCNHVRVEGKHELIIEGDEHLEVYADEHRIDQVVINFVNNAVKYAPDSREIYLIVEQEGDYARISVKDNGPGIPEAVMPYLFDRYYRASHAGKNYNGLGLGLYICAEIVKKHEGQIGVESKIGEGSTFWFTLPLFS